MRRRGDNIPPISDYAHWNEDAEAMWYAENRYDMEHADEIIEDDWDDEPDPEPFTDTFKTEAEARVFMAENKIDEHRDTLTEWVDEWFVEHWNKAAHERHQRVHR